MAVDTAVEALIADAALSAHLATSVDDRPHVAPVWYVYEAGSLWVLTGGRKLANLRRNPRVAVSIERSDEDGVDWGVQLQGTARAVSDEDRVEAVSERLDEIYSVPYGSDGGEDAEDWGLVELFVGSATSQRY